jgi:hypothetical protein
MADIQDDPEPIRRRSNASKNGAAIEVTQNHPALEEYERLFGVDEDAYEQPTTTRRELWAYYLYYNGKIR